MTGGIDGYEYGVTCPECGYYTELGQFDDPNEGVVCGNDNWYPDGENWGCGRMLRVQVEVIEEAAQ